MMGRKQKKRCNQRVQTMNEKKSIPQFAAKKAYNNGYVSVGFNLKCRAWHNGCANAKIDGRTDITTIEARELASALIQCADEADAKVTKKAKHDENRKKYREREIAAGRMIVIGRL